MTRGLPRAGALLLGLVSLGGAACSPVDAPPTNTGMPAATAQGSPALTSTIQGGSIISPLPSATPTAAPTPTVEPTPTVATLPPLTSLAAAPDLDLLDLGRRLTGKALSAHRPSVDGEQTGDVREFWAVDFETMQSFKVAATLRHKSARALFYVQDGITVTDAALEMSARALEDSIFPQLGAFLGTEWLPSRLTILHGGFPQVAGYYSYLDEFPPELFPQSNNRSMIYVNVAALQVGSSQYLGTLTHEIQHAMHWRADPTEETWLNEGMSENASLQLGYGASFVKPFLDRPGTSMTLWPAETGLTPPAYGAATLFLDFIRHTYMGDGPFTGLIADQADGVQSVRDILAAVAPGVTFEQAFQEWTLANYLDSRGRPDAYPNLDIVVPDQDLLTAETPLKGTVEQYAAQYVKLDAPVGDYTVTFQGQAVTPLLPLPAAAPENAWWSNRGDVIDSALTRPFDLRNVQSATLDLDLWYNLEEHWDYVYLLASTDGGKTWVALQTGSTSPDNPVGQALAPGYTGRSGGQKSSVWITDRVDLTPFAGKEVLVRLEYVTDAAVNLDGLALRRAAVPELGYAWDGHGDGGWQANGFLLTSNQVSQSYWVKLVRFLTNGQVDVVDIPLDADMSGMLTLRGLGADVQSASVIIMAMAPATSEAASYTLSLQPAA